MKLLKEPTPGEPWGVLVWVEMPTYHWRFYNPDGSLDEERIGPIEVQELWFDISNTEYHPTNEKPLPPK